LSGVYAGQGYVEVQAGAGCKASTLGHSSRVRVAITCENGSPDAKTRNV
jgi:hypothetical protein